MGRTIRKVPANWQHPLTSGEPWHVPFPNPRVFHAAFQPMHEASKPYIEMLREYLAEYEAWENGTHPSREIHPEMLYHEYAGGPPDPDYIMPFWPEAERTHFQMYENTSEGTPISPVFATPEEVARWCADNQASIFGSNPASYEDWIGIARGNLVAIGLVTSTEENWDNLIVPKLPDSQNHD